MKRKRSMPRAHGGPLSKHMRPQEYALMIVIADAKFALTERSAYPLDRDNARRLVKLLEAVERSPAAIDALVNPLRQRGDRKDGKPEAMAVEYLLRIELLQTEQPDEQPSRVQRAARSAVAKSWSKAPKYVERVVREYSGIAQFLAKLIREDCKSKHRADYLREIRRVVMELPHSQPNNPLVPVDW
jgi:hypothetical protein